jgi:hypothetical protein
MSKDNARPVFKLEPEYQSFASKEAARPIYVDVEKVEIYIPGDKHTVVSSLVTDEHRERWPEEYRRFKAGCLERDQIVGTRLDVTPGIVHPAMAKELEHFHVYTVEALASLSDTAKQAIGPGALEAVKKAQLYLETAKDNAAALAAIEDKERIAAENQALKDQIAELARQIEELRDAAPARRTRSAA